MSSQETEQTVYDELRMILQSKAPCIALIQTVSKKDPNQYYPEPRQQREIIKCIELCGNESYPQQPWEINSDRNSENNADANA